MTSTTARSDRPPRTPEGDADPAVAASGPGDGASDPAPAPGGTPSPSASRRRGPARSDAGRGPGGAPARDRSAGRPTPSAGTVWKVVAVLGVLGTIGFGLAWRTAESRATTEDGVAPAAVEMRTAGREFAVALTNFDAATIDADFDRIVAAADGEFAEEADRFYDDEIRGQLRDAQATSRSEIRDIYVQRYDGVSGTVFVVVDQTVANNLSPQPVTDTLRIELGLRRSGDEWKVIEVDVLDSPTPAQAAAAGAAGEGDGGAGGGGGETSAPEAAGGG